MKKFFIQTFGCQMNEHDSEIMSSLLQAKGYTPVGQREEADLIVVNTCSIREKSYQKAFSELGRHEPGNDHRPMVAVTGCVASHEGAKLKKRFPFIDIILGPDHIAKLPDLLEQKGRVALTDFEEISDYEFPSPITPTIGTQSPKALVTIMKGCDNTCSFCIVPMTRGPEASRPADEIVAEIQRLAATGVREVMLLGQNVNSYGTKAPSGLTFPQLLRRIDEETEITRLRFISPHPKDLSEELILEYGKSRRLCPQIHLPVQSGSNRVLKRMRRSYTREVYLRKVQKLRQVLPEIAITTDLIVGFPGETEGDFCQTLGLVEEVGYDSSYCFNFSPRPGTEAAGFDDDVPPATKKERLARLQELQKVISLKKNQARIGKIEEVLVEGPSVEGGGQWTGRSPHGRIVNFSGDPGLPGVIVKVEVKGASPFSLRGALIDVN